MKKILYVEDNEDTASAVKYMLAEEGYSVKIAYNAKQCMEIVKKDSFDLILLDVMLPDMQGPDIFLKLRNKVKARYVFISAITNLADITRWKKQGVVGFISKPFTRQSLIEGINRAFSEKQLTTKE